MEMEAARSSETLIQIYLPTRVSEKTGVLNPLSGLHLVLNLQSGLLVDTASGCNSVLCITVHMLIDTDAVWNRVTSKYIFLHVSYFRLVFDA